MSVRQFVFRLGWPPNTFVWGGTWQLVRPDTCWCASTDVRVALLVKRCEKHRARLGLRVEVRQTDAEPAMITWLHGAAGERLPVVLNPGPLSYYSYATRGASAVLRAILIEVHISSTHAREELRHRSVVSAVAGGVICGLGVDGYRLALEHLAVARPVV